jgi:hypothetical protein
MYAIIYQGHTNSTWKLTTLDRLEALHTTTHVRFHSIPIFFTFFPSPKNLDQNRTLSELRASWTEITASPDLTARRRCVTLPAKNKTRPSNQRALSCPPPRTRSASDRRSPPCCTSTRRLARGVTRKRRRKKKQGRGDPLPAPLPLLLRSMLNRSAAPETAATSCAGWRRSGGASRGGRAGGGAEGGRGYTLSQTPLALFLSPQQQRAQNTPSQFKRALSLSIMHTRLIDDDTARAAPLCPGPARGSRSPRRWAPCRARDAAGATWKPTRWSVASARAA